VRFNTHVDSYDFDVFSAKIDGQIWFAQWQLIMGLQYGATILTFFENKKRARVQRRAKLKSERRL